LGDFLQLFQQTGHQHQIMRFLMPLLNCLKQTIFACNNFLENFEGKCAWNGSKRKTALKKMFLRFLFATIQELAVLS
jgi:hypothetical protein